MVNSEKLYDLCICGAGYSGLVLAVKAARAGLLVCMVDLNQMVGRRILSTGNGRCNFTNSSMNQSFYYSNHNLDFITDNHQEIIDFFKELGVFYRDFDGYYYPITNQAKTIKEALENEVNDLSVELYLNDRVVDINCKDSFEIITHRNTLHSKKVVVATGGLAAATLGSSKFGYKIASKMGMKVTKLAPSLVGILSNERFLKELGGVRAYGKVSYKNHYCDGEIQFNKDGVSGYPVMCISRFIGFDELDNNLGDLVIDFIPYLSPSELALELESRFKRSPQKTVSDALLGLCNEKVISVILSNALIYSDTLVSKLDNKDIENLVQAFKYFNISINKTKGFDNAQVTAGGIDLNEIDLTSMESKKIKGLYFIGEVLDVDGICGGYNLTWAYTSADIAAKHIIKVNK